MSIDARVFASRNEYFDTFWNTLTKHNYSIKAGKRGGVEEDLDIVSSLTFESLSL